MRPLPAKIFGEELFKPANGQNLLNGLLIFLAVCAILFYGQEILIPIVLATLLSFLLVPCVRALQKLSIPKSIAIVAVVFITFTVLVGVAGIVASTLTNLAVQLPQYESNLREKAHSLKFATSGGTTVEKAANVLKDLGTELQQTEKGTNAGAVPVKPIAVEIRQTNFGPLDPILSVVGMLVHPLTQLGIVVLMVILFLFNREDLRNRMIRLAGTADLNRTTEALDEAGKRLGKMFTAQVFVNGTTGTLVGIALAVIGIPGAILWGVLTFVLRFVPYIGSMMAAVLPIIIAAAIGEGWNLAIITGGILIGIEIIVGQFLEPLFVGKMTGLSPVAIVASAAFWTALWGPIGLILATPITIGLLVVGRNIESLAFLEVLLGSEPVLTQDHALYQRLLASDAIEAAELAEEYVKDERIDVFLSDVAVPGLLLAHNDQLRGVLSHDRQISVVHCFSDMLDDLIPNNEDSPSEHPGVILVSPPGVLNFAATLAFSAFLKSKAVPHLMLNEDAIAPGRFPQIDTTQTKWVCLCYLVAPSEAKHNYVLRRLSGHLPAIQTLGVAWSKAVNGMDLQTPQGVLSLIAADTLHIDDKTNAAALTKKLPDSPA